MAKVTFLGKTFGSERERNGYAFQNQDSLIAERSFTFWWPLVCGFVIGVIVSIWKSNWTFFWVGLLGVPALWNLPKYFNQKDIAKYSKEHKTFLIELENKIRKDILTFFHKRYFSFDQKLQHISDLVNLINHKEKLHLTETDGAFLLSQYEKEHNIDVFEKEIFKLKDKNIMSYAKVLIKLFPDIDFENEEDYKHILEYFYEYLDRNDIEYDADGLEEAIISEYNSLKATHFENKLSRNPDKTLTIAEIEHLDGFEFEKLIGDLYKKAGYKVTVTKKSGDQGADLIVEKDGVSTAIQTKKYAGSVGNKAVQEVVAAMKYYDCDKASVITTGEFTKSAFELASRNGVQLIDSKGLNDLFDEIL